MDPRIYGGENGPSNLVTVCEACNLKKGDALFDVWLERLDEPYRSLAYSVYVELHRRTPEEFVPIKIFDIDNVLQRGVLVTDKTLLIETERGIFKDIANYFNPIHLERFGLISHGTGSGATAKWQTGLPGRKRVAAYESAVKMWRSGKFPRH
jgi:hypothetical protein